MIEKIASLEDMLIDRAAIEAVEKGCQKYKSTVCADKVETKLASFHKFSAHINSKLCKLHSEIKTMLLERIRAEEAFIDDFIKAISLSTATSITAFITEELYPHITNADEDKFKLGSSILQFNLCFDQTKLAAEYARFSSDKLHDLGQSNWVAYVAGRVIEENKRQLQEDAFISI